MKRETFSSQIGFLLTTAGLTIGLGNIYRFPYITGQYGGAIFVIVYIICLLLMGIPLVTMELSIGRGSRKASSKALQTLRPDKKGWRIVQPIPWIGNYVFQMFYNVIAAQMLYFSIAMVTGKLSDLSVSELKKVCVEFSETPAKVIGYTIVICVIGFGICYGGIQKSIEKISVIMLSILFVILIGLAVYCLTLPGAVEGVKFYLMPDVKKFSNAGLTEVISAAFGQAFFTLGFGAGSLCVFGSYLDKNKRIVGHAGKLLVLDTGVALVAGIIVFPACFTFHIDPANGPDLILITMPAVFNSMKYGWIIGGFFFVAIIIATLSTIVAAFENIVSSTMDITGFGRRKMVLLNVIPMILLSIPAALGMNIWNGISIMGRSIIDAEDFLVSNNLLPMGAMIFLMFCITRKGWGWENFVEEANRGSGFRFPTVIKGYCTFVLPVILFVFWIFGYIN